MDIISQNRQIVRFLGWEEQKNPQERFFGKFKKPNYGWIKENELGFDCCWNSLMEVVENIESLGFIFKTYGNSSTFLKKGTFNEKIWNDEFRGNSKIESVYNTCLEFIKWYDEQNK